MTEMRFKLSFRSRNTHNPTKSNFAKLRIKFQVYIHTKKSQVGEYPFVRPQLSN